MESIEDAYRLAKGYDGVKQINIGGTKPKDEAVNRLSSTVFASDAELKMIEELKDMGIEVEIRQVPRDQKVIL